MFFPLSDIVQFPFEVVSGVMAGLICKSYFATQMKNRLEGYESNLIKKQDRIKELENLNDKLEKRLKDLECYFSKDRISLN